MSSLNFAALFSDVFVWQEPTAGPQKIYELRVRQNIFENKLKLS